MKKYCIICAHPDDETLFFSSILNSFSRDTTVHCLTDGNADGRGAQRKKEFEKAMEFFGVENFIWSALPDIYDTPLDQLKIKEAITPTIKTVATAQEAAIFTHGPFGDYGHPHHIQVARAVHNLIKERNLNFPIYTPNALALAEGHASFDRSPQETWRKKLHALENIYFEEYRRFVSLIPAKATETFIRSDNTTNKILEFFCDTNEEKELKGDLGPLDPFRKSLEIFKENGLLRKF